MLGFQEDNLPLDHVKRLVVNERETIVRLNNGEADFFMALLQGNLDQMGSDDEHRGVFIDTLLQLAIESSQIPTCLAITGVTGLTQEPITTGGFCDVYKASWENQAVALKRLRDIGGIDKVKLHRNLCKEVLLWRQFRHRNILDLFGICKNTFSSPSIVSPWMVNGNVLQFVEAENKLLQFQQKTITTFKLISQVAQALDYLHNQKPAVIHQDVRCANILVNGAKEAVLSDFGLSRLDSKFFSSFTSSLEHGCTRWQAPELLFPSHLQVDSSPMSYPSKEDDEDPHKGLPKPSPASDVYALGMTALELITGKRPFSSLVLDAAVIIEVFHGRHPCHPFGWDAADWSFFLTCWSKAPADRPNACEVCEYLLDAIERKSTSTPELVAPLLPRFQASMGVLECFTSQEHCFFASSGPTRQVDRKPQRPMKKHTLKTISISHELVAIAAGKDRCNYRQLEDAYHVNISVTMNGDGSPQVEIRPGDNGGRGYGMVTRTKQEIEMLIELYQMFGHKM